MAVSALFLHADPTLTSNGRYQGDTHMKNRMNRLLATFVAVLAWSSSAYAGCTNAQFAGTWGVVFADGNTCRLILNRDGEVLTEPGRTLSTCFDPFRGETAPDSGTVVVASDCSAIFKLRVEGLEIDMYGRIAQTRDIVAGFHIVILSDDPWVEKGAFTMIREE